MNKQIKQLAEQAGALLSPGYNVEYIVKHVDSDVLAKFAELIVRECANFVENIFDDDGGHAPCGDYAKGVKQHFGIKE